MRDWLTVQAAERPDAPFIDTGDRVVSFGEADDWVARVAGGLDVAPESRVAVPASSTVEAVVAMLAVPRAGAVAVLLNPRLPQEERSRLLDVARVDAVVEDISGLAGRPVIGGTVDPAAPHTVVFTSGSSGTPKGVVLTWGNLDAAAAASAAVLAHRPGDRWLAVLPLFHVGGLSIITRSLRQGGTVVLESGFEAASAAGNLAEVELASLVPTMLRRILDLQPRPYRNLRAVLVGGGPIPEGLLDEARALGIPALPTYGMTETASQVATARIDGDGRAFPLPGVMVRIVDPTGRDLSAGSIGEIAVDGPTVFPGYLDETPRTGPHLTGDLGWLDEDGALQVVGRRDDLIISGGENIRPVEVEGIIAAHPAVEDVAVWGEPDDEWGEVVVAAVVGDVDEATLARWVKDSLAAYKAPKRWRFVGSIPRTPLGKLDRSRL